MNKLTAATNPHRGFSLIEVLVGITIFAIGMLALVQLQGSLTRSARDANLRTVAINIAEEEIESKRGFSLINVDTNPDDGIENAYEDIVSYQKTVTRGGLAFAFDASVTDYWYDKTTDEFTTTEPLEAANSDFKLMTVSVTWNDSQEFNIDETHTTSGRLGSGSIVLTEMISSITSAADAKSATGGTGGMFFPSINYNPGSNPEIISISLGENKFKESTTPLPDVIRSDELVETKFDVVTYSQNDAGATFLRREEFIAISCECTLRVPAVDGDGGLRPTLWVGTVYSEAEWVSKPYGESANNQQSQFCSICCRDHHDGGSGEEDDANDPGRGRFDPFRDAADYWSSGTLSGDHKHYAAGGQTVADTAGDLYVEACRLVRKDGFMRAAQDLRQEGLNSFPADYLDNVSEVAVYSAYVTDAVNAFEAAVGTTNLYELSPPTLTEPASMPSPVIFPASTAVTATSLPTVGGSDSQQLRSRGIYIDYLSDELRTIINCLDAGGTGIDCEVPDVTTALEIIPFFDVQLTWLSRWNETPTNIPVDVSNETILTNNVHSRGVAELSSDSGNSTVNTAIHKGNLGLTGTDPIDPGFNDDLKTYDLFVDAYEDVPPPNEGDIVITGTITSEVSGVKAADVEISATEAQCDRTNTGYICVVQTGANNPRLTVSNYAKSNVDLLGCSTVLTIHGQEVSTNNWTRFTLPGAAVSDADIVIKQDAC